MGEDFRAQEFAGVLKDAAVNSITVFAKCHQGMSYYPTKVGVCHPGLKVDLLGEMIEACHAVGIRVAAYVSTSYDQYMWQRHGEWRVLDGEGRLSGLEGQVSPLEPGLGRLCLNTPYTDYIAAQIEEVLSAYDVDGIFYDNYTITPCFGPSCMLEREALGLDSARRDDCVEHVSVVLERVTDRLGALVRTRKPNATVFFNGPLHPHESPKLIDLVMKHFSHIEIESLPGGPWDYRHFEIAARYLRNLGLSCTGQTGSFRRSWGDFGTVRSQAALDLECFNMLAQAAKCGVGDHLHPRGVLNPPVYERIGRTYRSVREKEPWCEGVRAVTELAIFLPPPRAHAQPIPTAGRP